MEKFTKYIPLVTLALVAFIALTLVGGNQSASLGASGTRFPNGVSADSTSPIAGELRGTTLTITGAISTGASVVTSLISSGIATVGTFTQGGGITATTTLATATTLLAANFDTENIIDITPGGASLTATLPASSTLPLGTTAGQSRTVYIRNATTTAGVLLTIAGGTGVTLRSASSTAVIMSDTSGALYGQIDFVRKTNSDISALITTYNN